MSRSGRVWVQLFLAVSLAASGFGEEEQKAVVSFSVAPGQIINQRLYADSINACGPSSMLNAVKFGDSGLRRSYQAILGQNDATKLRYFVDRYFKTRPSTVAGGMKRWGLQGVFARDLAEGCNEFLSETGQETCSARFLDRETPGESDRDHLERIHKWMRHSIQNGFPTILSLRSFAVRTRPEKDHQPKWEIVYHHYVVVVSVPAELSPAATGFEAAILDSNGGRLTSIHIHPEPNGQPFHVIKGNQMAGKWVKGRPFLLVTAPKVNSLRPVNLKWSERFLITANFLIGRF